jgi:hypothetical protein
MATALSRFVPDSDCRVILSIRHPQPTPIVNTDHAQHRDGSAGGFAFQESQDCIVAVRYSKSQQQPFRRTPSGRMANPTSQLADAPGPPGMA